jgi:hypothetical protein
LQFAIFIFQFAIFPSTEGLTRAPPVGRSARREDARQQALAVLGHIVDRELALAFFRPPQTERQQPRQPAVALTVHRQQNEVSRVRSDLVRSDRIHAVFFSPVWLDPMNRVTTNLLYGDFGPDEQLQARLLRRHVRPDDAGQAVKVRDRERGIAQFGGALDQLVGVRGALQKRKVRAAVQLGVDRGRGDRRLSRRRRI